MKSTESKNIIIIGAIGTAVNIIEQIRDARERYSLDIWVKGIIIDTFEKGELISEVPVVGSLNDIPVFLTDKNISFLFALYKPEVMKERFSLMQSLHIPTERYVNFIHPNSYVANSVKMGKGNVILSNSTIHSNVEIGDMNIINSNITIEHDTVIGNGNFLAAGSCIGSRVEIGNHCFIGLNSSLRENVILKEEVFVGMHSSVLDNFNKCKIAGVPAKKMKQAR